jgi:hypothetical protein
MPMKRVAWFNSKKPKGLPKNIGRSVIFIYGFSMNGYKRRERKKKGRLCSVYFYVVM